MKKILCTVSAILLALSAMAVPAKPGEETKVDLEMLFNATLQNPDAINQLFTTSK